MNKETDTSFDVKNKLGQMKTRHPSSPFQNIFLNTARHAERSVKAVQKLHAVRKITSTVVLCQHPIDRQSRASDNIRRRKETTRYRAKTRDQNMLSNVVISPPLIKILQILS